MEEPLSLAEAQDQLRQMAGDLPESVVSSLRGCGLYGADPRSVAESMVEGLADDLRALAKKVAPDLRADIEGLADEIAARLHHIDYDASVFDVVVDFEQTSVAVAESCGSDLRDLAACLGT